MRRVVVTCSLSLDGVMQGPGRPDEDARGGFTRGGWATSYNDEVMGRAMGEGMATSDALLLGRRTYQDLFSVWPSRTDNPYTDVLNNSTKYVVSRSLTDPLPWQNSVLLDGVEAVAALEGNLTILGSGVLVQALREAGLIDEYLLLIHPLLLGEGSRLFPAEAPPADLTLIHSVTTTKGVLIARYRT